MSEVAFDSFKKMDQGEFSEAKAWLEKHYSDFASRKLNVEKLFAKFERREMSTEDDARRLLSTKT